MSYTCIMDSNGAQTVCLPADYHLTTRYVSVENVGDGILIKPVAEAITLERLFSMIDEARAEEGDLEIEVNRGVKWH